MAPFALQKSHRESSLSIRENSKIRKPMMEKMRRDRINGSIERLKTLLQTSMKQQSGLKLDKADILEMTVSFLKQQAVANTHLGHRQGFVQCLEEARRYLSRHSPQRSVEPCAMENFQRTTTSSRTLQGTTPNSATISRKQITPSSPATMWRPW
ncbi:hypothetical protein JZ751_028357 [Albula glossodonta]|uniref:BHLH domain-containing protein n=1 Tax=Albula glossodonta TaxID=121402 RepID=A0A8T2NMT6_9TELE|nr:hypothetical protein JZ751_028357 [Albula glossodonta]